MRPRVKYMAPDSIAALIERLRAYGEFEYSHGNLDRAALLKEVDAALTASEEARQKAQARYGWLVDMVLYCDYGDNDQGAVVGWGIRHNVRDGRQFMFGQSIDAAIDERLRLLERKPSLSKVENCRFFPSPDPDRIEALERELAEAKLSNAVLRQSVMDQNDRYEELEDRAESAERLAAEMKERCAKVCEDMAAERRRYAKPPAHLHSVELMLEAAFWLEAAERDIRALAESGQPQTEQRGT